MFVFAIYLFALGTALVVVPNPFLSVFGIPETTDVWVRVVGMLVLILGIYYLTAARNEMIPMFRAMVLGRCLVLVFLTAYVLMGFAPPILILFGVVDFAAAMWTALALRA